MASQITDVFYSLLLKIGLIGSPQNPKSPLSLTPTSPELKELAPDASPEDRRSLLKCFYSSFKAGIEIYPIHARLDPLFMLYHPIKSLDEKDLDEALETSLKYEKFHGVNAALRGELTFAVALVSPLDPKEVIGASTLSISAAVEDPPCFGDAGVEALWFEDKERREAVTHILTKVESKIVMNKGRGQVVRQTFAATRGYRRNQVLERLADWGMKTARAQLPHAKLMIVAAPNCSSLYTPYGFSVREVINVEPPSPPLGDDLAFLVENSVPIKIYLMSKG